MILEIREFIHRKIVLRMRLRGSYTRALEEEVARLRAENWALVNSILGVAGIPPVLDAGGLRLDAGKAKAKRVSGSRKHDDQFARRVQHGLNERESATPLRRRSWQQIGRALESEDLRALRREREADTDTFPTPRNIVVRKF